MAGSLTLWGAGQILGAQFGKNVLLPDAFYLALIIDSPPTAYVSGQEINEPIGGNYVRATVPNDSTTWGSTGQLQVITTIADIEFDAATAAWGICRYWALCSQLNGGFLYAIGNLESSLDVAAGDQVVFDAGDLTISLGPFYGDS